VFLREMSDKINRILPPIMTTKTYGRFLYSALLTIFATYVGKPGDLPCSWSEFSKTTQNILQTSFLNNLDSYVSAAASSASKLSHYLRISRCYQYITLNKQEEDTLDSEGLSSSGNKKQKMFSTAIYSELLASLSKVIAD
jgi:hypothetical protein